jgi:transcriptional regulator with XRE-family HTH domain
MLTSDQLRMARAALRMSVNDLAALAGVSKGTIARIEVGYTAYTLTLRRLREVLEEAGVIFIEEDDGAGHGVRLKKGLEPTPQKHTAGEDEAAGETGDGGMKAAWDDFEDDTDLDALQSEAPALDPGMAEYWRTDPELWARLSEGGRETLSRTMFGDMRAAAVDYFRAGNYADGAA